MQIHAYKIIMTIHGVRDDAPVDVDRELIVVGVSPEDAIERLRGRYDERSLEAILSTREPLSYRATIDRGDILDVTPDPLKAVPPRAPIKLVSATMPRDYDEFWRELDTEIGKIKDAKDSKTNAPYPSAIRLYSYSYGERWRLQVRGHLMLADRSFSDTFINANAIMNPDDLRALRDAIQIELTRCGLEPEGES